MQIARANVDTEMAKDSLGFMAVQCPFSSLIAANGWRSRQRS